MPFLLRSEITPETIAPGRTRYLTQTESMMLVVFDFNDGPHAQPDPPHSHPHEQVSYLAEGEVMFFMDGEPTHLHPGDMVTIPGGVPHCIQVLTPHAKLVDTFHPIREDFLKK